MIAYEILEKPNVRDVLEGMSRGFTLRPCGERQWRSRHSQQNNDFTLPIDFEDVGQLEAYEFIVRIHDELYKDETRGRAVYSITTAGKRLVTEP